MTNFKLNFAAIIFAIFALTSCQKDGMNELQTATTQSDISSRPIAAEGIHVIKESVKTLATIETVKAQANSRTRGIYSIECGSNYATTTVGQGNSLDERNYPDCYRDEYDESVFGGDVGESFAGNDMVFHLVVKDEPEAITTHNITLSNMDADLDLFVFALTREGYIGECKAMSITPNVVDESINAVLAPGCYIIVVDGYEAGVAGKFTIDVSCSAVSANPPSITAVDAYNKFSYGTIYEDGSFQDLGFFEMIDVVLNDDDTPTATFREHSLENDLPHFGENTANDYYFLKVGSDEWSVYLRDDSRGINIQLDMNRKKVVYSDDDGNTFDLYDIISAN